jgi:hypothetical protein
MNFDAAGAGMGGVWYMESTAPSRQQDQPCGRRQLIADMDGLFYRRIIGRQRARSVLWRRSFLRCLSSGSSSCSRAHWDRHGLRSDLRHIGTAIEVASFLSYRSC